MNQPQRYCKRPVEVEAWQLDQGNAAQIMEWVAGYGHSAIGGGDGVTIRTLEGDHLARWGDWVVKGVANEFYPCKPDIFSRTYRAA